MRYIDYVQLNPFQKMGYNLKIFFVNLPKNIARFFKFLGRKLAAFFCAIGRGFKNYGIGFVKGDWSTKVSYLIMGTGCMFKGQVIKGLLYLAVEVGYIFYMVSFAWQYLSKFFTLGTTAVVRVMDYNTGVETVHAGDNSMLILLYSVMAIFITAGFLALYISNIKASLKLEEIRSKGKKPMTFAEDVKNLLDQRFHVTLLSLPTILVCIFTVLPLIFMILIAFTNYDSAHQPPSKLFEWIGFGNFADVFFDEPRKALTFQNLVVWTLVWAVLATVTNYIFGMIFALMINKKGIKFKSFFRTMFVMTIAVPQFVTLLLMAQILSDSGVMNVLLQQLGLTTEPIQFLSGNALIARATVVIVNMWIGIPYTILITSGILMNIPEELYESARIDGAGPVTTFFKITMPYMLFVTTPYLITQFVGNINNFNVIYFLTGGGPMNSHYYNAGYTDLLVTWLYKLTMDKNDYSLAATIGILVFIICASVSLLTFNLSKSSRNEEEFS